MPSHLQLATIHLRVADLERSLEFYAGQLGFTVAAHTADRVELSPAPGAPPILTLSGGSGAASEPRDAAGLFHAALLFPTRAHLGRWLTRAGERGVEFEGFADHGVSEALYFSDPDGSGLEFYVDRDPSAWPRSRGELAMVTRPLALSSLLAEAAPPVEHPLAGTRWGHLHLRVTDLERSETFYRREFGMEVTQRSFPGARFLAADGYHHHLGLNVWGHPTRPQPPGASGLVEATFSLAKVGGERPLTDPDGISLRIVPA